ncbi:MFS transporter [Yinghuangia soli]|uniref:MFS transporter n=1 Tax=Yinghuangia soli TaxID=2908204 RepID=A0AA41Q680_9ACTN|nr:MFS transporter [Yinghuangia soli]MCF2532338.1 MFS transporter [Yinghuangia soli]
MTVSFGLNFSAGVFFAPVTDDYGIGAGTLAAAAALSTAVTGLAQPLVGSLLDRVGAKRVIVAALALLSASYLVLGAARGAGQFVAAYVVLGGLGFAGSSTLAVSTLITRSEGDRAGPALARAAIGINLGQLVVPWAAAALFVPLGTRGTYAAIGLLGAASTVLLAAVLPADRPPVPRSGAAPSQPARQSLRGRGRILAAFGLHAATLYAMVLLLPKHAVELGWGHGAAGSLVAIAAASAAVSSALNARLLNHTAPERLLPVLHVARAVSLVLAAAAPDARLLVVAAVVFGAASFPVIPLTMAVVTRGLDPARLGRTLAPAWVLHQGSAGAGLALAALGHALTGNYRTYFAFGIGLSLLAAVLTATVKKAAAASTPSVAVAANPLPAPAAEANVRTAVRAPAS